MQNEDRNQMTAQRSRVDSDVLQALLEYRKTRSLELRDSIVMQYTGLVESIARRFAGSNETTEDLAQEGYIGLITAIDLYDPAKKVKFTTYATHFVIGQIKHYLRDRGKIIKEPAWLQELNQRMSRAIEALTQSLGRAPEHVEIAAAMGMAEDAVSDMLSTRERFRVSSIDGSADSEDEPGAIDMERNVGPDVPISFQQPVEQRIVLDSAVDKLKNLEQMVLFAFFYQDLNQTEIARRLGISCNYVSHILRNSTRKLKKILVTDELREAQMSVALMRKRQDEQKYGDNSLVVDRLTRLYNRNYFENRLREEISRASRIGTELAVLFVTIEGLERFIQINGTMKGDEAVVGTMNTTRSTIRRVDIVTRYSAETFGLILPFTGRSVEVVHARVEAALNAWLGERGWDLTRAPLSFDVRTAVYPHDASQAEQLTARALSGPQPPNNGKRAA
jgi:RNA polymerase sigma-B factor